MTRRDDLAARFARAGFDHVAGTLADMALSWLSEPEQIEAMAKAVYDRRMEKARDEMLAHWPVNSNIFILDIRAAIAALGE